MKFYGSRFCQRCGKLFSLTAPGDRLCAHCKQQPAAPAAAPAVTAMPRSSTVMVPRKVPAAPHVPVKRQRASEKGRHRPPRAKTTATGKNSGPVTGQRTLPMLRALAAAPAGLTTPQLAEHASSGSSWINALGTTRQLMLKQERLGRVKRAGTAAGNRTRESAVWRITEDGKRYVKEAGAVPAAMPEPDCDETIRDLLPATGTGRKALHVLHRAGIATLGDLLYVTSMELLALPQFGPACLEAVVKALASRGQVLIDDLDENNNERETIMDTAATFEVPVSYKELDSRTWVQLRECTYLAEMALAPLAAENEKARLALEAMARILSPDWDGK